MGSRAIVGIRTSPGAARPAWEVGQWRKFAISGRPRRGLFGRLGVRPRLSPASGAGSEIAGVQVGSNAAARFEKIMGLDTVELVIAFETRFAIEIPDKVAAQIATVGQLHQYVMEQLKSRESVELTSDRVYTLLTDLICRQLGVNRDAVTPDAHFVNDLGAD